MLRKVLVLLFPACMIWGWGHGGWARVTSAAPLSSEPDPGVVQTLEETNVFAARPLPCGAAEAHEEVKKELQELLEELKAREKDLEGKVRKEVVPHLKREIRKLKEWLRKFPHKDDGQEPTKT